MQIPLIVYSFMCSVELVAKLVSDLDDRDVKKRFWKNPLA